MEGWLEVIIGVLALIIIGLLIKIHFLRKAAREIEAAFQDRLLVETNTLIDISCRDRYMRRLAGSINTQLRKLRGERQRFQQGDHEIKEAVTGISHDLRTPLTAIYGYLELLEQEVQTDASVRYLSVIKDRAEALKQLTEELFRYSIAASTFGDTPYETVGINHVLEESVSAYYAALKSAGIAPEITMPEKIVRRSLNKNALVRIFANIMDNAIKYSDGDLSIALSEGGEITFANKASSLNKIQVGKLFNRFYTVETARKSTGLGLSIAKALTEQMNGRITARYANQMVYITIYFPE